MRNKSCIKYNFPLYSIVKGGTTLTVRIVMKEKLPENGIFVTGFRGIGFTGYIAVKHIVSNLNLKPIGIIETDDLPPFVWMEGQRLITPYQLYAYSDLVFLVAEGLPLPRRQYTFFKHVADWVIENRFREALLIGGLDSRFQRSPEDKVRVAPTSTYIKQHVSLELPLLEKGLMITGPVALMLSRFEVRDFPALALLPYASSTHPDPMAAAIAIEYLNKMYNLNLDFSELIKDAKRIEEQVREELKRRSERLRYETGQAYI